MTRPVLVAVSEDGREERSRLSMGKKKAKGERKDEKKKPYRKRPWRAYHQQGKHPKQHRKLDQRVCLQREKWMVEKENRRFFRKIERKEAEEKRKRRRKHTGVTLVDRFRGEEEGIWKETRKKKTRKTKKEKKVEKDVDCSKQRRFKVRGQTDFLGFGFYNTEAEDGREAGELDSTRREKPEHKDKKPRKSS
jgi:hypothetical protein